MIHVQICHQVVQVLTGQVEIWRFQPICFHIFGGPGSMLNPLVVSKHPFLYSDSDDCATCSNQSLHISKTMQIKHVQHLELLQLSDSAPSYALLSKYAQQISQPCSGPHLSRHCFPIRPGRFCAITDHFLAPYLFTSSRIRSSSSFVHAPFTKSGFRTFCHRCRHCTSVRSVKCSAGRLY